MKNSLMCSVLLAITSLVNVAGAQAQSTELDPQVAAPREIIVRVDAAGNAEVFKVATKANIKNDSEAALAINSFVNNTNKVQNVISESELDQVSSTESWYYWYAPYYYNYGYSYSYNYYGYNFNYSPYYYYNYGYYNYYYYRWF